MDGRMIAQAWRAWKESKEGAAACNPETLGPSFRARQYLENRLERAFQAGIATAENAPLLELNKKHDERRTQGKLSNERQN